MKKNWIIPSIVTLVLIIGSLVFYSSMPMEKAVENKKVASQESIEFLTEMGMTSSKTVKENFDLIDRQERDAYVKKLGVNFFTAKSLTAMMKAQNLVIGELKDYIGEIPEKNIKEFKANYHRLKPEVKYSHYAVVHFPEKSIVGYVAEEDIRPEFRDIIKSPGEFSIRINWTGDVLFKDNFPGTCAIRYEVGGGPVTPETVKMIAAQKYFNMEGKEVDENNNIFTKPVDPMIVLPYEDGYIVLTQWF